MKKIIIDADAGLWPRPLVVALAPHALFVFHDEEQQKKFGVSFPDAKSVYSQTPEGWFPNEYDVGQMLLTLNANISDVVILTYGGAISYESVLSYGWKTIGLAGQFPAAYCPDYQVHDLSELPIFLKDLDSFTCLGESRLQKGVMPQKIQCIAEPLDPNLPDVTLYSMGRYFPTKHFRHQMDLWSNAIMLNKLKSGAILPHSFDGVFTEVYRAAIEYFAPLSDLVLAVPPRASEQDRFAPIIGNLCNSKGIPNLQALGENHSSVA